MVTKPVRGQAEWDVTLNLALDELEDQTGERALTLRYAHDISNAALPLSNGVLTPLPLTFSVPPTDLDVTLLWAGALTITAAGNGGITVAPCDVSAGVPPSAFVYVGGGATKTGGFLTGTFSAGPTFDGEYNIGASATWRTYRLYGFVGRDTSSALAASLRASGNPPNLKTWMKAVVG